MASQRAASLAWHENHHECEDKEDDEDDEEGDEPEAVDQPVADEADEQEAEPEAEVVRVVAKKKGKTAPKPKPKPKGIKVVPAAPRQAPPTQPKKPQRQTKVRPTPKPVSTESRTDKVYGTVHIRTGPVDIYESPSLKYYYLRPSGAKVYVTGRVVSGKLQVF